MDIISFGLAAKANKRVGAVEAVLPTKADLQDNSISIPEGTTLDRPILGVDDSALRYNTDTLGLEHWNGLTWVNVSADITAIEIKETDTAANIVLKVGASSGDMWIASDTLDGYIYDGTSWLNIGALQGPQGVQGIQGETGETGNGITGIAKTSGDGSEGTVDTYTITFSDTTTTTFDVQNGADGKSIKAVDRTTGTGASGTTDVYTIYSDVAKTEVVGTFDVYNGVNGTGTVASIVAGTGIEVDATDPTNPIINVTTLVGSIDDLDDVDTTTTVLEVGNVLSWDGTNWIPAESVSGGLIATPSITSPLDGSVDTEVGITVTGTPYSAEDTFSGTHTDSVLEIATDAGFTTIVETVTVGLETLTATTLTDDTTYYARLKYVSGSFASRWSSVVSFTTIDIGITAPDITSPIDGTTGLGSPITITADAYTPFEHSEPQVSATWQYATDATFTTGLVESVDDEVNLTSWEISGLGPLTTYYVRVKYKSASYDSGYGTTTSFTTMAAGINTPVTTSPANGATEIGDNPLISTGAYSAFGTVEVHLSTDWQIATDAGFTTGLVNNPGDISNLTSWNAGSLVESTTYFVRARFNSASYTSAWTVAVSFTTASSFSIQYGLQWNNVADTYTRLGEAASWSTGSDFTNNETVQSLMRRCVLNTDGSVNYYLDATDSTLKEDGVTPAVLDGTDGNVMVQIPKFWVKYDNTPGAKEMWISTAPEVGYVVHPAFVKAGVEVDYRYYRAYKGSVSGSKLISRSGAAAARSETIVAFRTKARANGAGWELLDWNLLFAVQTLCFVEIGTFDSQAVLGNGNDSGGDYGMTTGGSNSIGNASSPSTNDDTWMSYRGIENFYADIFEWIDGCNINGRLVYVNNDHTSFASDVFTGDYVSTGVTVSSSGYIKDMDFTMTGFIPTVNGGSDSTYVPDYVYSSTGARVAAFGGAAGSGLGCGAAYLRLYIASGSASASIGAGISF